MILFVFDFYWFDIDGIIVVGGVILIDGGVFNGEKEIYDLFSNGGEKKVGVVSG